MAKKQEPGRLDIRPPYGSMKKPESAMIKQIAPIEDKEKDYDDIPVQEQTVTEDGVEPDAVMETTRKTPVQMKFVITKTEDYDSPFRVDVEETGPSQEEGEGLECPNCGKCHPFRKASIGERKVLTCPNCKQKIASTAIIKTASGYKVVMPKIANKENIKEAIKAVYAKLQAAFNQLRGQKSPESSTTTAISEISSAIGRLESLLGSLPSKDKE